MLDARTLFHHYATGITPAMAFAKPGTGSAYAYAARDSEGRYLDGGKTYKITLPAPIPAAQFWSFMVYDGQTRSMLETDQKLAGLDSTQKDIQKNPDGSVTVWFAPKPRRGMKPTGFRPCLESAGIPCCGSTRPCNLGSTRRGSRAISSGSTEKSWSFGLKRFSSGRPRLQAVCRVAELKIFGASLAARSSMPCQSR
jgi:hypothetical protein